MLVLFCPSCSAGLQLPRSVLATRARRICCAICEHRWIEAPVLDQERRDDHAAAVGPELALHAENVRSEGAAGENPPEDLKVAADPATPLVGASPRPAHRPRVARRRPGRPHPLQDALPRTWPRVAAGVGVMAMLMLGLARREDIVRVAPSLAGAYAAIGLPVNIHGLEWREVRTSLVTDASQKVLAVEGEIRNLRSQSQTLPDIQLIPTVCRPDSRGDSPEGQVLIPLVRGDSRHAISPVASHRLFTCRPASACQENQGQQPEPTPSITCRRAGWHEPDGRRPHRRDGSSNPSRLGSSV